MDWHSVINSVLALVFVLSLIALTSVALRKYGGMRISRIDSKGNKRIRIVDALVVDARRKLLLVRRDDVEHLILISADKETIIETNIKAKNESKNK